MSYFIGKCHIPRKNCCKFNWTYQRYRFYWRMSVYKFKVFITTGINSPSLSLRFWYIILCFRFCFFTLFFVYFSFISFNIQQIFFVCMFFYDISTFVGYSMPNQFYTNKHSYSKYNPVVYRYSFCLHTNKYQNTSISNNSV